MKNKNIMKKNKLLYNTLSQNAFWMLNKQLVRQIGIYETLLLSDLITKDKYFTEKGEKTTDGFFFNTRFNIEQDTTLTSHNQRKALNKLILLGLIETKEMGLPKKTYYKVVNDKCLKILTTGSANCEPLEVKNIDDIYNNNKSNKNKEIKSCPADLTEKEAENNTIQSSKICMSSVEKTAPSKKSAVGLTDSELLVFAQYKKHIYPTCTKKTQSFINGVSEAIDLFNEIWGEKDGVDLLVQGIKLIAEDSYWKNLFNDKVFLRTPKLFFNQKFLENNIIPLINKKYGSSYTKSEVSQEDISKAKQNNERAIADFLGKNTNSR